ncbi:MAG: rod shape-determining protein [Clostridia bacterium]|nr:rod shape-determining protein [Clostridia bacterium]
MNLGIDLGTSRVTIYQPGRGVLLDEPAVIAVDAKSDKLVACGNEAVTMLGRTPDSIRAVKPLKKGVIAEYALTEQMLWYFLRRVCSNRIAKPCVAVSIAEKITEVERRSFIEAVYAAGARKVTLVPQTVAAAIGAGLDVSRPCGQMVINIGGGTTDVSVLSLKGVAVSDSARIAGDAVDEAIARYIRAQYGLIIGELTAEELKIKVGGAMPREEALTAVAKGRDSITGLPREVVVTSDEISEAMAETVAQMTAIFHRVLEVTPPEMAGDILRNGLCVTGGMAQMYGLTAYMTRLTGLPCFVPENPALCAAIGAGTALQYSSSFSEIYDLNSFSYRLSGNVTN